MLITQGEYDQTMEEDQQERLAAEVREFNARRSVDNMLDRQISEGARRQQNRVAIEKVEKRYGRFRDLDFKDFKLRGDVMKDLRMNDLKCIGCGLEYVIDFVVFRFNNFDESVRCRNCQYI